MNTKFPETLNYIAIGFVKDDLEYFEKNEFYKGGKIYIDEKRETYEALNYSRKSVFSLLNPQVFISAISALQKGYKGSLKGDGFQLGGTMICDYKGDVIYQHVQTEYEDNPKEKDIYDSVIKYYLDNEDK